MTPGFNGCLCVLSAVFTCEHISYQRFTEKFTGVVSCITYSIYIPVQGVCVVLTQQYNTTYHNNVVGSTGVLVPWIHAPDMSTQVVSIPTVTCQFTEYACGGIIIPCMYSLAVTA